MYQFKTKSRKALMTNYSPKEIAVFCCFDAFLKNGDSIVVETKNIDFKSFEFIAS